MKTTKENTPTVLIKRAQPRFIQIDEPSIENFSIFAMAVYMQLRLLSDFTKDCDEVKITADILAQRSKISRRKCFHALNELENQHHVIQRLTYRHIRFGQVNAYNVARDYGYFKPAQAPAYQPTTQPVDNSTQHSAHNALSSAHDAPSSAPHALGSAPCAYLYESYISSESLKETTTSSPPQDPPKSSSFFSLASQEKILALRNPSDNRPESEFLANAEHHIINNSDLTKSVYQRTCMLIGLLKKLKESGDNFKANGFYKAEDQKTELKLVETDEERRFRQCAEYEIEKERTWPGYVSDFLTKERNLEASVPGYQSKWLRKVA